MFFDVICGTICNMGLYARKRQDFGRINAMNAAYVYLQLYRLFDSLTPTKFDCGRLCRKACCKGDTSGMYLFPGEKKVFDLLRPDWERIETSEFQYEFGGEKKRIPILFCNGKCDRYQRPLACRIFPLTPYLEDGKLRVIIDPRAKAVCPLSDDSIEMEDFDADFVKAVYKAFKILLSNKEFYAFMEVYSEYISEYFKFFNK